MVSRATPLRRDARLTDGGRSFSTPVPHPQLTDPACNGGLARWGTGLVSTLLDDTSQRRRLTLRTSADEGRVWSDGTLLVAGACAYSVALELPDGALAVVWEAGDYDEIVFGRIERDHLASLVPVGVTEGAGAPPEVGA
ncbi:MAG TPA: glycoside hydrolase [Tessaracoccus flavescens]|uniref:Glycoside hydrolase n=1 Tax=Tessaracoccus flavescens TaxID=399497 RepID=A0A921JQ49_9ACTN|nr:glycoside hydrolase [Tessaracoccus flavescens]